MFTYEAYHFGENNMISNYHNYNFVYPRNLHRSFEFIYVKEGEMQISINNAIHMVKANQAALILPYESHSFLSTGYSDSYISVFSHEFVKCFDNMIHEKALANPVIDISQNFKDLILDKIFSQENNNPFQLKGCLYLICAEFINNNPLIESSKIDYELIHKVLAFVQKNYTNDISLKDIANEFNYSYTYISKYLNSTLGISFADFLNEHRISQAACLLKETDRSITDIAYACGYSNIRSFNRNFYKIIKQSPTDYRKLIYNA